MASAWSHATGFSGPFADGLHTAFDFAIGACLAAVGMSWLRGGKYHYTEADGQMERAAEPQPTGN